MKYIVDLDDTLVNTTELNNDAYNYALKKYGYCPIETDLRITRNDLQSLTKLQEIINIKQYYFSEKWLPYRVIINDTLLGKIKRQNKSDCYIWTKADKYRAEFICKYCNLNRYFSKIIFDKKTNISQSISYLGSIMHDDMLIYENNMQFFANSSSQIVDTIKNKYFNINGYFISNKNQTT